MYVDLESRGGDGGGTGVFAYKKKEESNIESISQSPWRAAPADPPARRLCVNGRPRFGCRFNVPAESFTIVQGPINVTRPAATPLRARESFFRLVQ